MLLDHGCHRISVNPQPWKDSVLQAIGRRHTAADIEKTMGLATSMGFQHEHGSHCRACPPTPRGSGDAGYMSCLLGHDNHRALPGSEKGQPHPAGGQEIPTAEEVGQMLDYSIETLRRGGLHLYYL